MISLFSFLRTGTAFMVIVQFRGRLVRQYRACVVSALCMEKGAGKASITLGLLVFATETREECL